MEEIKHPKHEEVKRELLSKFTGHQTYIGSFVKEVITKTDFKSIQESRVTNPPEKIKKGDVIIVTEGTKTRPAVICKVLKNGTCIYIPLTSSENIHCLSYSKSRFFGEGCFSKSFSVCTEEFAIRNFVNVYDNMKDLNKAIKELKQFLNINLK